MKTLSAITLLSCLSAALAVPAVVEARAPVPAPKGFKVTSLGVIGTGCPPGSFSHSISEDETETYLTLDFTEYFAAAGPGIAIRENRKNCRFTLGVSIPEGYQFSLKSVSYNGFYSLDSSVVASHNSYYYFQGQIDQSSVRSTLAGPVPGKRYTRVDPFDSASAVRSPCGTASVLNIQSELRVSNSGNNAGYGFIARELEGNKSDLLQTFALTWQKC